MAYNKELRSGSALTGIENDLAAMKVPSKRQGKPCLLERLILRFMQTIVRVMRAIGAVVNASVAIVTTIGVIPMRDKSLQKETCGLVEQMLKNRAKFLLYRMGRCREEG